MDTKNKVIEILEEMRDFFDQHNVDGWTKRTQLSIRQLHEDNPNIKKTLNDFVGLGMGSLIDLYICSDNGHRLKQSEIDTNKHLQTLTDKLLTIKSGLDKV